MNAVAKEKCPFSHMAGGGTSNRDWWPNQLRIDLLHQGQLAGERGAAPCSLPHPVLNLATTFRARFAVQNAQTSRDDHQQIVEVQ
jgi:hypothetical protein